MRKKIKNKEKVLLLFAVIIFIITFIVTILFYFIFYLRSDQIISRAVDAFIKSYKDAILYNYEITPTISNANSEKISDYTLDIINHMDLSLSMKNNADNMNIILDINSNYKKNLY